MTAITIFVSRAFAFALAFALLAGRASAEEQPVVLQTIDSESRKPVAEIPLEMRWTDEAGVEGEAKATTGKDGKVTVKLPLPCVLEIVPKAAGFLNGFGYPGAEGFALGDVPPEEPQLIYMERGVTIEGTLLDEETGKPVEGARVAPNVFTPPGHGPDRKRQVVSDEKGNFRLTEVDPLYGVKVTHDRYQRVEASGFGESYAKGGKFEKLGEFKFKATVQMQRGPTIRGRVIDPQGKAVAGVRIQLDERTVKTDAKGAFVIYSPGEAGKTEFTAYLDKKGYLNTWAKYSDKTGTSPMDVTIRPWPRVSGRVVDAAGNPVTNFRLRLTVGIGFEDYQSSEAEIENSDGKFSIPIKRSDGFWLSVFSEDHPPHYQRFAAKDAGAELSIEMPKSTSFELPYRLGKGIAADTKPQVDALRFINLREEEGLEYDKLAFLPETPSVKVVDGKVFIEGLATAAHYQVILYGPTISPYFASYYDDGEGREISKVTLVGRGTIKGRIFLPHREPGEPLEPWSLVKGEAKLSNYTFRRIERPWNQPISFQADGDGRFVVKNVPAGDIEVGAEYNASADIIGFQGRTLMVWPGETVECLIY